MRSPSFKTPRGQHRRAKETGQRYLFYEPDINARAAQTLLLESKLRAAEERQQFLMPYQPIVSAERSSEILGVEALLRWQDPGSGLVYPDSFVPMLEDTGLIVKVGYWVMRQALALSCGIGMAIDDFGIGYSSLSYLARLPINTVKIDRTFVSKMTAGPQSMAVVSAIISLARALRLKVVAEGVET